MTITERARQIRRKKVSYPRNAVYLDELRPFVIGECAVSSSRIETGSIAAKEEASRLISLFVRAGKAGESSGLWAWPKFDRKFGPSFCFEFVKLMFACENASELRDAVGLEVEADLGDWRLRVMKRALTNFFESNQEVQAAWVNWMTEVEA